MALDTLDWLDARQAEFGERVALTMKEGGRWQELTYRELSRRARAFASWLGEWGLGPGDRLCILSEPRPEWAVAFFGGLRAGAVIVPLDPRLGPADLAPILTDSGARVLCASADCLETGRALCDEVPSPPLLLALEDGAGAPDVPAIAGLEPRTPGSGRPRSRDSTALLVYTSGTTGAPKGVELSAATLMFQVERLGDLVGVRAGDTVLSVLPLHHLLELTGGFLAILNRGGRVCFARSLYPHDLAGLMREQRVAAMIGVPLLFRTLGAGIERQLEGGSPGRRLAFRAALRLASLLPSRRARRLLFRPLHRRLGGRLRLLVSGGAPLEPAIARFFDRLGLPLLQGYGLTETGPVVSVNTLGANRIGSVGRPLPGVEVRIAAPGGEGGAEGEILTRGPHLMRGYHRREDLTREVVDGEGWFHTGDLGRLDGDGFLHVTGRLKNLIVLGSGKKVQPEEVEAVLGASPLVREVCVLGGGGGGEQVWAVVVAADGTPAAGVEEEIGRLARRLPPHQRPARVAVLEGELPRTASRKLRRDLVRRRLEEELGMLDAKQGGR